MTDYDLSDAARRFWSGGPQEGVVLQPAATNLPVTAPLREGVHASWPIRYLNRHERRRAAALARRR